jgi:hypothetical protein
MVSEVWSGCGGGGGAVVWWCWGVKKAARSHLVAYHIGGTYLLCWKKVIQKGDGRTAGSDSLQCAMHSGPAPMMSVISNIPLGIEHSPSLTLIWVTELCGCPRMT